MTEIFLEDKKTLDEVVINIKPVDKICIRLVEHLPDGVVFKQDCKKVLKFFTKIKEIGICLLEEKERILYTKFDYIFHINRKWFYNNIKNTNKKYGRCKGILVIE